MLLCVVQTGNMVSGETTCERYSKTNYRVMHRQQQEAMAVDKRSEELQKKRMSTLSLDDSYTRIILPNNETKNGKSTRNCCMRKLVASWNMCTSTAVPSQIQILTDTKKSYERLLQ